MNKKVLIITSSIDRTVDYIIKKYNHTVDFYRLDVDKFLDYKFVIGGAFQWKISSKKWLHELKKGDVYSIYYRKPRLPSLDEYEPSYKNMIAKDIIALINGIVDDFEGKVLSKPSILRKTENKTYQLLYAERNGWIIPQSFIGNSNSKAEVYTRKKSIIKPLGTGKIIFEKQVELYQTNYFNELKSDISLTPIYLQEYIEKKYEVRITYINGDFYCVRIDSRDKLDWRKDYSGHQYSVIDCPLEIKSKCIKMLKDFELRYGAFDFIINKKGEWIFLEINPNGQWLWLEQALKLSISKKIVDYLCI